MATAFEKNIGKSFTRGKSLTTDSGRRDGLFEKQQLDPGYLLSLHQDDQFLAHPFVGWLAIRHRSLQQTSTQIDHDPGKSFLVIAMFSFPVHYWLDCVGLPVHKGSWPEILWSGWTSQLTNQSCDWYAKWNWVFRISTSQKPAAHLNAPQKCSA